MMTGRCAKIGVGLISRKRAKLQNYLMVSSSCINLISLYKRALSWVFNFPPPSPNTTPVKSGELHRSPQNPIIEFIRWLEVGR